MLGIELLTLSSGVKQITIYFDFFELIFIQLLLVQLTALSIDYCITDTSSVVQISNSLLSSTYLYKGTCDSRSLMYNKKTFRARQGTLCYPSIRATRARTIIPCYNLLAPVKQQSPNPPYNMNWYFNFNLAQRALVLEDFAPALGVGVVC